MLSRCGTIYQGTLNKKPTPMSSDPHIIMKMRRKTVLLFDLPPRRRFLKNSLENQRATVTANTAFITEARSMSKVASGDQVK
jgi:hypothetical protein